MDISVSTELNIQSTVPVPVAESHSKKRYFCYIITTPDGDQTYNGYTINLRRRLRQHNGELRGGAKATKRGRRGSWKYIAILTCPNWTAVRAMQHEWTIKYPTRRKPRPREYQGSLGRIRSLEKVCEQIPNNEPTSLYVHPDFIDTVNTLSIPVHVSIKPLGEIISLPQII